MRILAVADTTENWPENIGDVVTTSDAVFCLGDLYSVDIKRLVGHGTPVYGVYGNHCRRGYLRDEGATEVAVDGTAVAGVHYTSFGTVLGVNGCVRYSNAADLQYTQDEFAAALDGLPPVDIVLTHCPPRGVNDHTDHAHFGIDALRDYVLQSRPRHLFHGHTYPELLTPRLGGTVIHYVHGWSVVEI